MDGKFNEVQEAFAVLVEVVDLAVAKGVLTRPQVVTSNECINKVALELGLGKEPLQKVEDEEVQAQEEA